MIPRPIASARNSRSVSRHEAMQGRLEARFLDPLPSKSPPLVPHPFGAVGHYLEGDCLDRQILRRPHFL